MPPLEPFRKKSTIFSAENLAGATNRKLNFEGLYLGGSYNTIAYYIVQRVTGENRSQHHQMWIAVHAIILFAGGIIKGEEPKDYTELKKRSYQLEIEISKIVLDRNGQLKPYSMINQEALGIWMQRLDELNIDVVRFFNARGHLLKKEQTNAFAMSKIGVD